MHQKQRGNVGACDQQQQRGSNTAWTWEHQALTRAERRSANAMRLAAILTVIGGIAFIGSGALMYAAVRRARADAGAESARAVTADQRFKATFDQSGVGFMHIDKDGRPLLVNDAMCDMTGYSRVRLRSLREPHLTKPFSSGELRRLVQQTLRIREKSR